MQPLNKKNPATSPQNLQKNKSCNLSEWEKSRNLSTHKNHTTSPHTKSCNLSTKHRKNRKTLPLEHHIGCQMYKIALSKKTEKVKKKEVGWFFCWEVSWFFSLLSILSLIYIFFLLSQYFWKEQFVTHDNRCDFLRAAFCDSRDIFNNDVLKLLYKQPFWEDRLLKLDGPLICPLFLN